MDNCQEEAVNANMSELCETIQHCLSIFLAYLQINCKLLGKCGIDTIERSTNVTDYHRVFATICSIMGKTGSWEALIGFLNDNKFDQLANKLTKGAEEMSRLATTNPCIPGIPAIWNDKELGTETGNEVSLVETPSVETLKRQRHRSYCRTNGNSLRMSINLPVYSRLESLDVNLNFHSDTLKRAEMVSRGTSYSQLHLYSSKSNLWTASKSVQTSIWSLRDSTATVSLPNKKLSHHQSLMTLVGFVPKSAFSRDEIDSDSDVSVGHDDLQTVLLLPLKVDQSRTATTSLSMNTAGLSDLRVNKPREVMKLLSFNRRPSATLNSSKSVKAAARRLKSLRKRSKIESPDELLVECVSLMQTYSTATVVQLECIQLAKSFVPQNLSELTDQLKMNLIVTMLTCLQTHSSDESVVSCCTDALAEMKIYADSIERYTRTVETLLKIISDQRMPTSTKRSTIDLLNTIAIESDEHRLDLLGHKGAVERICEMIRQQLNMTTSYDRILQYSWCCLVNICVTDSNKNDKRFLAADGMNLLHDCYLKFGDEKEMVESMMGFMMNLSDSSILRSYILNEENLNLSWNILTKFNDDLAISCRCAQVFANFLLDSPLSWPLVSPTVDEVKIYLMGMINKWKLGVQPNLSQRSFKPELVSLKRNKSELFELLTVWQFANFITVEGPEYCRNLRDEGGVEVLNSEVFRQQNASPEAVRLAKIVVENVEKWGKGHR